MTGDLQQWYEDMIADGALERDAAQEIAVIAFQNVIDDMRHRAQDMPARPSMWGRLGALLGGVIGEAAEMPIGKGLYVHGGVGRGKTMIMDKAYELLDIPYKRRCHFNDFMLDVHRRLKLLRAKAKDSRENISFLKEVAAGISSESHVLAFDEFQVRDVADAMIMSGLFSALFEAGVIVMTTSNVAPDDLYKGGLQRQRFLPFIDVLKEHMEVIHMDSATDYRLQDEDEEAPAFDDLYLMPMNSVNYNKLENTFFNFVTRPPAPYDLELAGRNWHLEQAVDGQACLISFASACETPRAAEDYIALAQHFPAVFLYGVPKMGYDRRNEAKRFILLIDSLYDQGCRLMLTAEAVPEKLYYGTHHAFEFERTISRLQEMRRRPLDGEG